MSDYSHSIFSQSNLILIVSLFFISYYTDSSSKQLLHWHSLPVTLTFVQLLMSAFTAYAHLVYVGAPPSVSSVFEASPSLSPSRPMIALIACQTIGFLTTNMSLGAMSVGFTHTVKACEALFTALFTRVFGGIPLPLSLYLSLLPIVFGVSLSSLSELSFSWSGLLLATVSNACFAGRSVGVHKMLHIINQQNKPTSPRPSFPSVHIYFLICLFSSLVLFPLMLLELYELTSSSALPSVWFFACVALNGVAHYTYNTISLLILARTNALVHVVMHACRRVFVLYFNHYNHHTFHHIQASNVIGTCTMVAGVIWFALEKSKADQLLSAARVQPLNTTTQHTQAASIANSKKLE